jgi:hypothetical protein
VRWLRLAAGEIVGVLMACSTPAVSAGQTVGGFYPPMSVTEAQTLAKKMAHKWMTGEPIPYYWWKAIPCTRLGTGKFECQMTLYRNAATTIPYVALTIDVWNGQVASNGNYYKHEVVAAAYRY